VVQEGDGSIELHLGWFGAGDGKANRAQGVARVLLDLASRFARNARKQADHQTGTPVQEAGMTCAPH
jgi:hypothetical protein